MMSESSEKMETSLLERKDMDSLTAAIDPFLLVIKDIGKIKVNGKPLFKTKGLKKIMNMIRCLFEDYCGRGENRFTPSWLDKDVQENYETLKGLVKIMEVRIGVAVNLNMESPANCPYKKLQRLFAAHAMIKDVLTAVRYIPTAWRDETDNQLKLSA